jgi:hypothetical protein
MTTASLLGDTSEHGGLHVDQIPTANIRRNKSLYRQMAIATINGGLMGRGICIKHTKCVVDGIHMISPDPDGNYIMGHRQED